MAGAAGGAGGVFVDRAGAAGDAGVAVAGGATIAGFPILVLGARGAAGALEGRGGAGCCARIHARSPLPPDRHDRSPAASS